MQRCGNGGNGMKCPKCGAENPDNKKFCSDCGKRLSDLDLNKRAKQKWVMILTTIIIVIIIMAIIVFSWRPWTVPNMVRDLNTNFNDSTDEVTFSGSIFNYGDRDGYATLQVTITDNRGYSKTDTIQVGLVKAKGGESTILKIYDWPDYYNGKYCSDYYVLPLSYSSVLSWTNA